MSLKVIDNFLDKEEFDNMQSIIMGDNFPWYYNLYITDKRDIKNISKSFLTHTFYREPGITSSWFYLFNNFLQKINCKIIMRVKANLHLRKDKHEKNNFHTDYPFSHKGCLFYINDNNGLTYFEKESIKPKANRVVFFDPSKKHASSSCTDEKSRININFNYF